MKDRSYNSKAKKKSPILSIVLGFLILSIVWILGTRGSSSEINLKTDSSKEPLPPPPLPETAVAVENSPPPPETAVAVANSPPKMAVIISTAWIPIHSSAEMIEAIVKSIRENVIGLNNEETPICITVEKNEALGEIYSKYVKDLQEKYTEANIHVVEVSEKGAGANIWEALQLIKEKYPGRDYLYHVQHNFKFAMPIDHMALIETMRAKATSASDKINYILFPHKDILTKYCQSDEGRIALIPSTTDASVSTTVSLCRFCRYTDSIHLVEFEWYYKLIDNLGYRNRSPESSMRIHAQNYDTCKALGLYFHIDEKGFAASMVN